MPALDALSRTSSVTGQTTQPAATRPGGRSPVVQSWWSRETSQASLSVSQRSAQPSRSRSREPEQRPARRDQQVVPLREHAERPVRQRARPAGVAVGNAVAVGVGHEQDVAVHRADDERAVGRDRHAARQDVGRQGEPPGHVSRARDGRGRRRRLRWGGESDGDDQENDEQPWRHQEAPTFFKGSPSPEPPGEWRGDSLSAGPAGLASVWKRPLQRLGLRRRSTFRTARRLDADAIPSSQSGAT